MRLFLIFSRQKITTKTEDQKNKTSLYTIRDPTERFDRRRSTTTDVFSFFASSTRFHRFHHSPSPSPRHFSFLGRPSTRGHCHSSFVNRQRSAHSAPWQECGTLRRRRRPRRRSRRPRRRADNRFRGRWIARRRPAAASRRQRGGVPAPLPLAKSARTRRRLLATLDRITARNCVKVLNNYNYNNVQKNICQDVFDKKILITINKNIR